MDASRTSFQQHAWNMESPEVRRRILFGYIYIYMYIIKTLRETRRPWHTTSNPFSNFGCQLNDASQLWCQLGHLFASFWGTFEGSKRLGDQNATRKHPAQKRYHSRSRIVLFFGVLFGHVGEDVVPKCVFVSMCLASVVLHRKCLDYRTPRIPIIRLKRSRIVQNQGFANLGKVWKSDPPDTHFDVIFETFGRHNLTFLCFIGSSGKVYKMVLIAAFWKYRNKNQIAGS